MEYFDIRMFGSYCIELDFHEISQKSKINPVLIFSIGWCYALPVFDTLVELVVEQQLIFLPPCNWVSGCGVIFTYDSVKINKYRTSVISIQDVKGFFSRSNSIGTWSALQFFCFKKAWFLLQSPQICLPLKRGGPGLRL